MRYIDPETGLPFEVAEKIRKTIQKLMEENTMARGRILALENENNALKNRISQLEAEITNIKQKIGLIQY